MRCQTVALTNFTVYWVLCILENVLMFKKTLEKLGHLPSDQPEKPFTPHSKYFHMWSSLKHGAWWNCYQNILAYDSWLSIFLHTQLMSGLYSSQIYFKSTPYRQITCRTKQVLGPTCTTQLWFISASPEPKSSRSHLNHSFVGGDTVVFLWIDHNVSANMCVKTCFSFQVCIFN